jgi:uncharacterized membrane protein YgdD (TMEM256/DUF423 family)
VERLLLMACGASGFLAVGLGAFGAHGLKARLADLPDVAQRLSFWQTAASYHLSHSLALALSAYLVQRTGSGLAAWSGGCFAAGMLLFSGSLYAMTLTGAKGLGAVTPVGGLLLLAGWACVALAARTLGNS